MNKNINRDKKIIKSFVLLLTVLLIYTNTIPVFAAPSDWAYESIYWAKVEEIAPSELLNSNMNVMTVTRERLAEILVNAYALSLGVGVDALPAGEPFEDTTSIMVGKAYQAGLMSGITETQFAPLTVVTRLQVINAIEKLLIANNIELTQVYTATYTDLGQVPQTNRKIVHYLYGLGAFSGFTDTTLNPNTSATAELVTTLIIRVLTTHNWLEIPSIEVEAERVVQNGFSIPQRTFTELTIYQPSNQNGIRTYYTGLQSNGSTAGVEKSHRQLVSIAERYPSYTYDAVLVLAVNLEDAWDTVKKQYSVKDTVYINGTTGAVSTVPIYTSNYIKIYSGNRLMIDYVK